jgi:hypothetical protein
MTIDHADPVLAEEEGAFFTFRPRPDRPELFDEQTSFIDSLDTGVSFCIGGNGSGTTIAAACKLARFLLYRQAPLRFDFPFWVVGPDFEQTIESFWKEKLFGLGFIPEYEIDWERVTWHDKRRFLPRTVPLLPWINGDSRHNWVIEFRSTDQGRTAMQAREIGGFCLTEQFPWEILTEILRGMRRNNLPGSKFCEFTPIDPVMSRPLQEMIENDAMPPGWKVYRANTKCNVDDPNSEVTQAWFDEFFGMVSDEMRDTRQIGAWATYEGLMYRSFNPKVHVFPNDKLGDWPIPVDAVHRRTIDWGTGPSNAFVVLWFATDSQGRVYVYDEYYTTEPNTHEDRMRDVHRKDGWDLCLVQSHPASVYELRPLNPNQKPRWRYDLANFQQTYGPPDDPGMFRECDKYCMPVSKMSLGPNSYHPSVEHLQSMFKYSPEGYALGNAPRLFISRRCTNLIREVSQMRWQKAPRHGVNPRDAKPYEVERDNHAPSALRGGVWSCRTHGLAGVSGHRVMSRPRPQTLHRRVR